MLNFSSFPISETNEAMRKALGRIVTPELKRRGFTGKMPHFRRILDSRVDVLGVQFNRHGGSFVVEIGSCGTDGIQHYFQGDPNLLREALKAIRHFPGAVLRRLSVKD